MSSSSSPKNVVSPHASATSASANVASVHPISLLPSYNAPVFDKSSISMANVIKSPSGKTQTKNGSFNCSKTRMKLALTPIIENQKLFFECLEIIDTENTANSSSASSSLKDLFEIEFPISTRDRTKTKYNVKIGTITHSSKDELATMIVNSYKIFEIAKTSQHFGEVL